MPVVARTVRPYAEKDRPEARAAAAGSVRVGPGPLCCPVRDEKRQKRKIGVWDLSQHLCFSREKGGRAMTTREVAESSSPLTHLERVVKWSARRQKPAASLVFFRGEEGLQVWPGTPIRRGKPHLEAISNRLPDLADPCGVR